MRLKFKTRKTISQVLSVVLLCALGLTAIFGVSALSKNLKDETKVIYPMFEVGGIGEDGKSNRANNTIYTESAFACDGLEVKLAFDADVKFQVFYYDELDNFKRSTQVYSASVKLNPEKGLFARIVVYPTWGKDVAKEDRICHWYDVYKYSSKLEISVNKEQLSDRDVTLVSAFNVNGIDLSSKTSVFEGAIPMMYADNDKLFGEKIVKIGLPVQSVADCTIDNVYTIYVVEGVGENATKVERVELVLPANTYAKNNVGEYVYFNVDITLDENETLVFGATSDTICCYYSTEVIDRIGNCYVNVFSDSCVLDNKSLLFDIVIEEH